RRLRCDGLPAADAAPGLVRLLEERRRSARGLPRQRRPLVSPALVRPAPVADGERAGRLPATRRHPLAALRRLAVQPPRPHLELPAPVPRPPLHPLPQSPSASAPGRRAQLRTPLGRASAAAAAAPAHPPARARGRRSRRTPAARCGVRRLA